MACLYAVYRKFKLTLSGLQGVGHPRTVLYNTRPNMVQLPTPHIPTLSRRLDSRRTSDHPLRRASTYTATLPIPFDTEYTTDRGGARSLEYSLLGCQ